MNHIVLCRDDREIFRALLEPGEYVIGRDPDVQIFVDIPDLSRRHARLVLLEDDLKIEDLDSSNGTFVDDEPVSGLVSIAGKKSVRLGDVSLEIQGTQSAGGSSSAASTGSRFLQEELANPNRYEVGGMVAHGGMGNIMDALQKGMRREVAMKVMRRRDDANGLLRFVNEARITGELEHPNIVPVHELGVDENGQVFYTMKFVRGITLAEVISSLEASPASASAKYPLSALLTIFQKVCDAIAFAHSKGIIHRDLKPENIMLGDFGEVLVMDWGLAKRLGTAIPGEGERPQDEASEPTENTIEGAILGTPRYMAPEQARGEIDSLDFRTDIYALGTILHEMLYLRPVVSADSQFSVIEKVAHGERDRVPLNWKSPHLPGGRIPVSLRAVRRKALAFVAAERYQHVADLQADLAAYQAGFATGAEGAGLGTQLALLLKRHRGVSRSIALGIAALAAVSAFYTFRVVGERNRAETALEQKMAALRRVEETLALVEAANLTANTEKEKAQAALTEAQKERLRADGERDKALTALAETQQMRNRATSALAELKEAGPMFIKIAENYVKAGKMREAVESLDYAVNIAPQNPTFQKYRADILQSSKRLPEAIAGYQRAIALQPDEQAKRNLALAQNLLAQNGGQAELKPDLVNQLVDALEAQGRAVEAALLAGKIPVESPLPEMVPLPEAPASPAGPPARYSAAELLIYHKLKDYTSQAGWNENRIATLPIGGLRIVLAGLKIGDLSELRGDTVAELDVSSSNFDDLESIAALPLRALSINSSRVKDLGPLRATPLTYLNASNLAITDISALERMPLAELHLSGTAIPNLKPLRNMPLRRLRLAGANLSDLNILKGLKVDDLDLSGNPFDSLAPLRGMPLRILRLAGCDKIKDFPTLAGFENLQIVSLPAQVSKFGFLSNLKFLQAVSHPRISPGGGEMAAADFIQLCNQTEAGWLMMEKKLKMTDARDLRAERVTALGQALFAVDLRGTGITNLQPLAGLPISRLAIDTKSARLDLTPLSDLPLADLDLSGSNVTSIEPLLSIKKLDSLAAPFSARDIQLLMNHPTLRYIGYEINPGLGRPATGLSEFFAPRGDDPAWPEQPPAGQLAANRFDDPVGGGMDWQVANETVKRADLEKKAEQGAPPRERGKANLAAVFGWRADPPASKGRGGGCVSVLAEENQDDNTIFFKAPKTLLGDWSANYLGCIEFELRQTHAFGFFDAPDVELRSGPLRLVHAFRGPPTSKWQTFSIPLQEGAWRIGSLEGKVPSAKDFQNALAAIDDLLIRAEYCDQPKFQCDLDDFRIWNPESATARLDLAKASWQNPEPWVNSATFVTAETGGAVTEDLFFTYLGKDVWIGSMDGHQGMVLLHPTAVEQPAAVTWQISTPVTKDSRMTIVARGSEIEPGVEIRVIHRKKTLATEIIDRNWKDIQVALPEMNGKNEAIIIEIQALQWDREYCYIDDIRIEPGG